MDSFNNSKKERATAAKQTKQDGSKMRNDHATMAKTSQFDFTKIAHVVDC
jgi:hypothetical protein